MECWPSLAFGFALLLVGLIITASSFFIQETVERKSFFFLGSILLALGSWVFSQTPSKFLVIRNPALPMNLSFVALHVLPILLVNYIIHSYPTRQWIRYYVWVGYLFLVMYIITFFLQLFGIAQYTDLLLPSGPSSSSCSPSSHLDHPISRDRSALLILLALGCILLSIVAECLLAMNIILDSGRPASVDGAAASSSSPSADALQGVPHESSRGDAVTIAYSRSRLGQPRRLRP